MFWVSLTALHLSWWTLMKRRSGALHDGFPVAALEVLGPRELGDVLGVADGLALVVVDSDEEEVGVLGRGSGAVEGLLLAGGALGGEELDDDVPALGSRHPHRVVVVVRARRDDDVRGALPHDLPPIEPVRDGAVDRPTLVLPPLGPPPSLDRVGVRAPRRRRRRRGELVRERLGLGRQDVQGTVVATGVGLGGGAGDATTTAGLGGGRPHHRWRGARYH